MSRYPWSLFSAGRMGSVVALGVVALSVLLPHPSVAQTAGSAYVTARVTGNLTLPCAQSALAPVVSVACQNTSIGNNYGVGSAFADANNAQRSAYAFGLLMNTSPEGTLFQAAARATATQSSELFITGTPGLGDLLALHFRATTSLTGMGGYALEPSGVFGYGEWSLNAFGGQSQSTLVHRIAPGGIDIGFLPAAPGTGVGHPWADGLGYDLFLPLVAGSTYAYSWQVSGGGIIFQEPNGAMVGGSISATLEGIDAVSQSGAYISSATFDGQTGFGSLNLTTTAPEPQASGLLLLGFVLVGVAVRMTNRTSA